jgi:excisionase family DNA binding protein
MTMLLTVDEAATLLHISPRAVRARLQRGELKGHKDGGQWRVSRAALPLTAERHRELQARADTIREVVDNALPSRAPSLRPQKRHLPDLMAFRALVAILQDLRMAADVSGRPAPVVRAHTAADRMLETALEGIGRAWPIFAPQHRLHFLDLARSEIGGAIAWLAASGDADLATLAARIEDEVLPPLSGMCRSAEHRGGDRSQR